MATGNKLVSRTVWIELLRILACFCVILLHVSTKGWSYAGVDTKSWSVYEIFCAISRIGVCCFVMISGSLFLGNTRGQSIEKIYKKYKVSAIQFTEKVKRRIFALFCLELG